MKELQEMIFYIHIRNIVGLFKFLLLYIIKALKVFINLPS